MGTATPKTGQIAFSDLNTGILNAGSTASLNMNTAAVRMGYGSTSQVSLSQLRGCAGGELTIGDWYDDKLDIQYYGYTSFILPQPGSITGEGYVSGAFVSSIYGQGVGPPGTPPGTATTFEVSDGGLPAPSGWQGTDITRAVINNVSRSIIDSGTIYSTVTYTIPVSGSTTWGLKFG